LHLTTRDGVTLNIQIYRLDTPTAWSMKVVNGTPTSIVSGDKFQTSSVAGQSSCAP
jgi:hypothetical protein